MDDRDAEGCRLRSRALNRENGPLLCRGRGEGVVAGGEQGTWTRRRRGQNGLIEGMVRNF